MTGDRYRRTLMGSVFCLGAIVFTQMALPRYAFCTAVLDNNPLPDFILPGEIEVAVVSEQQLPVSKSKTPVSQINMLVSGPGQTAELFVGDMRGQIYRLRGTRRSVFFDLASKIEDFAEEQLELGLLSFAFHPDFATPRADGYGKFYTVHTVKSDSPSFDPMARQFEKTTEKIHHYDVLMEWEVMPDNLYEINPQSGRQMLVIAQPLRDHNTGLIAFNPNARPGHPDHGNLYIGVGDGGNTVAAGLNVDAYAHAQDLRTPLGKILRINPLQSEDLPYSIPLDNPFLLRTQVLPEIWAYGFRNPQRFSWDSAGTGKMIVVDIGQKNIEEVNLGVPGGNYGWGIREGTFGVVPSDEKKVEVSTQDGSFIDPVAQYDHDEGFAISGGYVYRGSDIPPLVGKYVFGDIPRGRVFYVDERDLRIGSQTTIHELILTHDGKQTLLLDLMNESRADLRFGVDRAGELYLITKGDGKIRRLGSSSDSPLVAPEVRERLTKNRLAKSTLVYAALAGLIALAGIVGYAFFVVKKQPKVKLAVSSATQPTNADNWTMNRLDFNLMNGRFAITDSAGVEQLGCPLHAIGPVVVLANERPIARLECGAEQSLGATLKELSIFLGQWGDPESEQEERRIELSFEPLGADSATRVSIYHRRGNRRYTSTSFAETREKLLSFLGALATQFEARNSDLLRLRTLLEEGLLTPEEFEMAVRHLSRMG